MDDIIKEIEFNNEKNILINEIDEWLNLTENKKPIHLNLEHDTNLNKIYYTLIRNL